MLLTRERLDSVVQYLGGSGQCLSQGFPIRLQSVSFGSYPF